MTTRPLGNCTGCGAPLRQAFYSLNTCDTAECPGNLTHRFARPHDWTPSLLDRILRRFSPSWPATCRRCRVGKHGEWADRPCGAIFEAVV